jgi:hypothetical protein
MAVLQPLYISQARYTPGIDRKLLAGIFDTTSAGALMTGVLPPTDHFRASSSGVTVSVTPGFCVIPDSPSQNTDSPGVYFCTIDATNEPATAATAGVALATAGVYKIYAEVNETTKSITTAEISATNTAKITTATAHGYSVGQTVLINGVNDNYNGSYVITAVTTSAPFTFSFTKTGTIGSPATVSPASATSSVPFAIKYAAAYPTGTANFIPIATATTAGSNITLTDERTFVSSRSGIQLYRSTTANGTITTREAGSGRLAYDLDTNKLYAYVNSAWKLLVDGTTGHHDTANTGAAGSIHHLIGTGAYDASAGNHSHDGGTSVALNQYGFRLDDATVNNPSDVGASIGGTSSSSPTVIDYTSITISKTSDIFATSSCSFNITGTQGYVYFALRLTNSTGGTVVVAPQGTAQMIYPAGYVQLTSTTVFTSIPAGTYRVQPIAYKVTSGTITATANWVNTVVTPIKAYS